MLDIEQWTKPLHPYWVTGFSYAEGCFYISITAKNGCKVGREVRLYFEINLHHKDKAILVKIKNFFSVGEIFEGKNESILYVISSYKNMYKIIDHYSKYQLITQKRADYELFKQAFNLVINKKHLTPEG